MDLGVYLIINKGDPDQVFSRTYITGDEFVIGRRGSKIQPDLAFSSLYISRKHAIIRRVDDHYQISDEISRHGTEVNGVSIRKAPHILRHGDRISLAGGVVELVFYADENEDDITREIYLPKEVQDNPEARFVIHAERRELIIDGVRFQLTGKYMDLFLALYHRKNEAVSYDELKASVWPERMSNQDEDVPGVEQYEINALVYRLRKRLGKYGQFIVTIPRYGYMLEI